MAETFDAELPACTFENPIAVLIAGEWFTWDEIDPQPEPGDLILELIGGVFILSVSPGSVPAGSTREEQGSWPRKRPRLKWWPRRRSRSP